ncbi:MAG: winged helix-turn-helix domain-containing protein [Myxococcales bacterium]|nr:winged helix-turn-helix domain-containing protein [Myxococcales bacterium]
MLLLTDCRVDLSDGAVWPVDGGRRQLRELERDVLAYLAARPERIVSQEELLVEVWGYSPDAVTHTVYSTVGRLRKQVERDPARPVHVVTERGQGYRFVPLAAQAPAAHRTQLVGRAAELAELERRFAAGARLVTLLGPGGIGKTRLALQWAGAHQGKVCDLSTARSSPALLAALQRTLGIPGSPGLDGLGATLAGLGPLHLVLDNLEQVVDGAAEAVAVLMRAAPDVRLLATSRVALRLSAESILSLGPLTEEEGLNLVMVRAEQAGRTPRASEQPALRRLVAHVEGIPLALELAASRLTVLPADDLLRRLQRGPDLLRDRRRDGPARHVSMEATARSSWELLEPATQRAAAQCTVFAGSFDAADFETVVDTGDADAVDTLAQLEEHSWVRVRSDLRLGMFEVLRRVAREALADDDPVFVRHMAWAVTLPPTPEAVDELTAILDRRQATDPDTAVRAGIRACDVLLTTGPLQLEADLLDRLRPLAERGGPALVLDVGLRTVRVQRRSRRSEESLDVLDALRPQAEAAGPLGRGEWWHTRGATHLELADHAAADDALGRALSWIEPLGDSVPLAKLCSSMGVLRRVQGRLDEALAVLQRSADLYHQLGRHSEHSRALVNLLMVAVAKRDWSKAHQAGDEAVTLARRLGQTMLEATALSHLAIAHHESGRSREALATYEACMDAFEEAGAVHLCEHMWGNYALVLFEIGAHDEAFDYLERARGAHERRGNQASLSLVHANRGIFHDVLGRAEEAEAELRRALELFGGAAADLQALIRGRLAGVLADAGRLAEAQEQLALARRAPEGAHTAVITMAEIQLDLARLAGLPQEERTRGLARVDARLAALRPPADSDQRLARVVLDRARVRLED